MEHTTDICELKDEKAIISCLKGRFERNSIYTYIAKVLIAINPFKNITGLYSEEKIKSYRADTKDELDPHLYAVGSYSISLIYLFFQMIQVAVSSEIWKWFSLRIDA